MAEGIENNAEARLRRRAAWGLRAGVFLFAILVGGLAWSVILDPALAGGAPQTILRAALAQSPAILLAVAAWHGAGVLRWFAPGRAVLTRNAASLAWMGLFIFLAGLMQVLGAPALLASLNAGELVLRTQFGALGLALMVLGLIAHLAGWTLRDS